MPEEEKKQVEEKKDDSKMVPLDTSGPGAEVDLPDDQVKEAPTEEPVKTEQKEEPIKVEEVKTEEAPAKEEPVKEETKQDTLEEYSEGVKKRISKLTRKMREAERREKAALDYAAGAKREIEITRDQFKANEEKYDKAFTEKVKESMTSAQQELADAISSGDAQKQVAANRKIAALSIEEARLNAAEKMRTDTKEQVKTPDDKDYMRHRETPKELPSETPPDPQAQAWAEKNDWFGQDRAMTFTAFEIHKDLVEKEGFDPKSQDYYAEIDKRIRVDFPHKFDKGGSINTTKPVQTVASASTSAARSIKPGRKTVKLTPSQVAIAKKLNVPLEDYAKQLSMKEV